MLNDKYYVGMHSTSNLKDGYLGSGKSLRYAIRKYGEENFKIEIIEWCKNNFDTNEFIYVSGNSEIEDFYLMSKLTIIVPNSN